MISMLVAHAHNIPVVIVAPGGLYDASDANERRSSSSLIRRSVPAPISTARSSACSAINDLYMIGTRAWADAHGGDSSTIKFLELPISPLAAALDTGRIDAGATIDPDLQQALNTGKVRILLDPNGAIAPRFMYTGWMATTDYVRTNAATVVKFRDALIESAKYVQRTPFPQTVDVMSKFTDVPAAVVFNSMPRVLGALSVDPKLLQPLIDTCAKYKAIPASFDARELIDPALR